MMMRQACHILSCNLSCKDSPLSESTALDSQESHLPGLLVLAPVPFPHPNFPPLAKTWIAVLLYLPMAILIKIKHSLARKKKKKYHRVPVCLWGHRNSSLRDKACFFLTGVCFRKGSSLRSIFLETLTHTPATMERNMISQTGCLETTPVFLKLI